MNLEKCKPATVAETKFDILVLGMKQVTEARLKKLKSLILKKGKRENDPSFAALRDTLRVRALKVYMRQDVVSLDASGDPDRIDPPNHLDHFFTASGVQTAVDRGEIKKPFNWILIDYIRMPSDYLVHFLKVIFPDYAKYPFRVIEKGPLSILLANDLLAKDVKIVVPHNRLRTLPLHVTLTYRYKRKNESHFRKATFITLPFEMEENPLACATEELVPDIYLQADKNSVWLHKLNRTSPFILLKRLS